MAAGPDDSGGAAADGGLPGFGEAHRRLLADDSIQFDLRRPDGTEVTLPPPLVTPNPTAPTAPPPPIQHDPAPVPMPTPPRGASDPVSGGMDAAGSGATAQIIFWVVLGLAVAALLFFIVTRLAGWRRTPRDRAATPDQAEAPAWQMAPQPARTLLDQADAIAAAGRYAEAAHFLLHRSIEEIDQRRPAAIRKALTSRDIARLPGLPPGPAAGFAGIVRAVERSLFADRPLGAEDWSRCRTDYQHFAFAENWAR